MHNALMVHSNVKVGINYIAVAIDVATEKLAGYRYRFLLWSFLMIDPHKIFPKVGPSGSGSC